MNITSKVTDHGTRTRIRIQEPDSSRTHGVVARSRPFATVPPLQLAVYCPSPASHAVPPFIQRLGRAVRARTVHQPQDVRASDDLVVVVAGASTFLRGLTDALGPLTPPVLVVARRHDEAGFPNPGHRATGYLVVGHTDVDSRAEDLMAVAVLAVAGRKPVQPEPTALAHAEPLTQRESDIMNLLATGRCIREIAQALSIGDKTVRNYLSNIYRKLGVRRQAEALLQWLSTT